MMYSKEKEDADNGLSLDSYSLEIMYQFLSRFQSRRQWVL